MKDSFLKCKKFLLLPVFLMTVSCQLGDTSFSFCFICEPPLLNSVLNVTWRYEGNATADELLQSHTDRIADVLTTEGVSFEKKFVTWYRTDRYRDVTNKYQRVFIDINENGQKYIIKIEATDNLRKSIREGRGITIIMRVFLFFDREYVRVDSGLSEIAGKAYNEKELKFARRLLPKLNAALKSLGYKHTVDPTCTLKIENIDGRGYWTYVHKTLCPEMYPDNS